jgi:hypothetical protein
MCKIKYALVAISHPTHQLTASEVTSFLVDTLPEYRDSNAKTGWFTISGQLTPDVLRNAAIESFGYDVSNDNKYSYRTISFSINNGDGRIFVIYEKN